MLAIHDHVTRQMSDRLETTRKGLGLVRLLQDAKRFGEAHAMLIALEKGATPPHPKRKWRKISRKSPCLEILGCIDAA